MSLYFCVIRVTKLDKLIVLKIYLASQYCVYCLLLIFCTS